MDKEMIEDLKVLLEILQLKNECLYTVTLNKIKSIIEKIIPTNENIYFQPIPYEELKLNIYLDLKVGLSHLTRKIQPPYLIDFNADVKYHKKEYEYRFKKVLINIRISDYLYGTLSCTPKVNDDLVSTLNKLETRTDILIDIPLGDT